MYKLFLTAVIFCSFSSCDLFTNGGPCTYEDKPFKATIVSIEKATEPSPYTVDVEDADFGYDVKVVTNLPNQDTLELDEMTKQKITDEFLQRHQLTEGTVLEGVANVITSGTCAPGGYRFKDSTLNAY